MPAATFDKAAFDKELRQVMGKLRNLDRKEMRAAMRAAMREVNRQNLKDAKAAAPRSTGRLRRSLKGKLSIYTSTPAVTGMVGQNTRKVQSNRDKEAGNKNKKGGLSGQGLFVPIWLVEGPTAPHTIPKRRPRPPGKKINRWFKPKTFAGTVRHRGTPGQPFIESTARRAYPRSRAIMARRLGSEINKYFKRGKV